jgi:acetate kinase
MNVLVLNAGSSSLKFQLIATDAERIRQGADERLCRGEVERIGGEAIVTVEREKSPREKFTASLADLPAAVEYLIRWFASGGSGIPQVQSPADIHAVGHRVVHGGEMFSESALITDEVLKGIEDCIDLAPLHNPNNIKGILAARQILGPKLPQVAVFDTVRSEEILYRTFRRDSLHLWAKRVV